MFLSELCLRRPVFATVLTLFIVLLGIVAYGRLAVREYPQIDEPIVSIKASYPGASAELMETQVTKPIEDAVASVEGVNVLESVSRAESSQITLRFRLERNPEDAAADVRDAVSKVRGKLPDEVDDPVISKVEADASPVISLALSSDSLSLLELSDIADSVLTPSLQRLPGLANVRLSGERLPSMQISLHPEKLAAFGLTPSDMETALRQQNVDIPAGRLEGPTREFKVVARTALREPTQFEDVVVRVVRGYPVRIRDVGEARIAPLDERSAVRLNGRPAVVLGLLKQATANPLRLGQALKAEFASLKRLLPEGVTLTLTNDTTVFIERSIASVYHSMAEAILLVGIVVLVFLGSARASLIPLITIPVCLVGTFSVMLAGGFTLNTLTLLSLVVAVGLVVDDAIVVVESVHRHLEKGLSRMEATQRGVREVAFAVVATTAALVAVYLPVAFAQGRTGRLFTEFALTLVSAVLTSGLVALTLSPVMCAKFLGKASTPKGFALKLLRLLNGIRNQYGRCLAVLLRAPSWMGLLGLVTFALAIFLWSNAKRELAPQEDRSQISIAFNGPDGASIGYSNRYAREIERLVLTVPEVDQVLLTTGRPTVAQGQGFLRLLDWELRDRGVTDILQSLQLRLRDITGVKAVLTPAPALGLSTRQRPFQAVVLSNDSYAKMQEAVAPLMQALQSDRRFQSVENDLRLSDPEFRVSIDRERAADLGIEVDAIVKALETAFAGRQVSYFQRNGKSYDVVLRFTPQDRESPRDISKIFVHGEQSLVPLSAVVSVQQGVAARELNRFGQQRAITISANLGPGLSLGEAVDTMEVYASRFLKSGYHIDFSGQSREYRQSSSALAITFLLALCFVYLVLAVQFESFLDPIIIMVTVPLSMAGALATLKFANTSINVYSQIGLITLLGLITKHGILMVDAANTLQKSGMSVQLAIIEAAKVRLRPILMTTFAMVLGSIPLAFGTGAGAESRAQMGLPLVGGLAGGTFLTLFFLPCVYVMFAAKLDRVPQEN